MTGRTPKIKSQLTRYNARQAKTLWPDQYSKPMVEALRELTTRFEFSVASGDIRIISGHWYVTHSGLLRLADRRRCNSICVEPVLQFSDPAANRWVFKATVRKSRYSRGFVGFGDADPTNVSSIVHGAEMRIAETRAVNRALRKAYGIGLCSVEELGWSAKTTEPGPTNQAKPFTASGNGHQSGQPRLRDQLCLLIRHYNLDPALVKAYAAHFCGTETLKEASRDLVESFISHLADSAKEDRDGLICKLNSYAQSTGVHQ